MARSFMSNDIIVLPRLSALAVGALLREMLTVAGVEKKLPASIAAERDDLAGAQEGLQVELKRRLEGADSPKVKAADLVEDTIFAALFDWLRGWSKLPDRFPQADQAREIVDAFYADGLRFTLLTPKLEWQEAEARIGLMIDKGYDAVIKKLGGQPFLDELFAAHKAYGEALGITAVSAGSNGDPLSIGEKRDAAMDALRSYVLRVAAHVRKSDPESAELAARLLAPLTTYKDRPVAAGGEDEGAPAKPEAGAKPEGAPKPELDTSAPK